MQTYIAILRGINVSGHKPIKMNALRAMLEGLKFKNVRTYIQSGNVVFEGKKANPATLQKQMEKAITKTFGFEVPVIVIEVDEIKTVLKDNLFVNKRKEDITRLHVTFLATEPDNILLEKVKEVNYKPDEFMITGKAIYLFCPNGYGNSKLSNTFFENKLKVSATTRNWKTVNALLRIAEG